MLFCGFNKTTLLDYPEHVAATIFLGGCNFRCPFCQNSDLLIHPADYATYTEEEILTYLQKRSSLLSGVCISGGEPTIYNKLPFFIKKLKELGYLVKIDTNGSNPNMIKKLYHEHLIDYVAMDIKTGLSDYLKVAGISSTNTSSIFYESPECILSKIKESAYFLMNETDSKLLDYEFRTTVVRELHSRKSFMEIAQWLSGAKKYFIQSYKESDRILTPGLSAYSADELEQFLNILKPQIPSVKLRGID